jgi:hypothetical protein
MTAPSTEASLPTRIDVHSPISLGSPWAQSPAADNAAARTRTVFALLFTVTSYMEAYFFSIGP